MSCSKLSVWWMCVTERKRREEEAGDAEGCGQSR